MQNKGGTAGRQEKLTERRQNPTRRSAKAHHRIAGVTDAQALGGTPDRVVHRRLTVRAGSGAPDPGARTNRVDALERRSTQRLTCQWALARPCGVITSSTRSGPAIDRQSPQPMQSPLATICSSVNGATDIAPVSFACRMGSRSQRAGRLQSWSAARGLSDYRTRREAAAAIDTYSWRYPVPLCAGRRTEPLAAPRRGSRASSCGDTSGEAREDLAGTCQSRRR